MHEFGLCEGVLDTVRFETSANGATNIPELGTVKTEEGFRNLYTMSSYLHVKDGTSSPAVLLTTGMNDPRVDPWLPGKMTARLQAATSSGKPVTSWMRGLRSSTGSSTAPAGSSARKISGSSFAAKRAATAHASLSPIDGASSSQSSSDTDTPCSGEMRRLFSRRKRAKSSRCHWS